MSYFLKSGSSFRVATKESMDLHSQLPVGTYTVKFDQMSQSYYLDGIEGFEINGKIYGDTVKTASRILSTFHNRSNSTGVLLNGEKGSGKTMLAKLLSVEASKQGIPTIVINSPWCGDNFNAFMQMIEQPTVILFDEFEKVYDQDDQERMLTLLDGVYPSKKLFVLTCNDKWRINDHMRNRPGRIYYLLEFKGLEQEFIIEYCQDNLINKDNIQGVCNVATIFDQFNFDMLKALVEEMNRYNETAQESMKMLNARPEFSNDVNYHVSLQAGGIDIETSRLDITQWHGNPLTQTVGIDYKVYENPEEKDSDWDWEGCRFNHNDIVQIDSKSGTFVYVNKEGDRLKLTRTKEKQYNYFNAF
jgi:hypothetical protein